MAGRGICTCPEDDPPSPYPEDFPVTMAKSALITQWRALQIRIDELPEEEPEYWLIKGMEFELLAMWCSQRYCICRFDYPKLPFSLPFEDHSRVMELYSKHVSRCCLRYRKTMLARDREFREMKNGVGEISDEEIWRLLEAKGYEEEMCRSLKDVFDQEIVRKIVVKVVGEETAAVSAMKDGPLEPVSRILAPDGPVRMMVRHKPRSKRRRLRRWARDVLKRIKIKKRRAWLH